MKSFLLAVIVLVAASVGEARAQWGSMGYGLYGNRMIPPQNFQDRMPYFALYPPVYYSYPVPRPYGYSPFAYPGYVPTPHVEQVEVQTILNPYVVSNVVESGPAENVALPAEPKSPSERMPSPAPTPAPKKAPARQTGNRTAQQTPAPQPLVIINPYFGDNIAGRDR